MPLTLLIPLILQYGIPFAEKMFTLWTSGAAPTADDWTALKTLASSNAQSQMLAALARAGISPTSPQGVALLQQVPTT